MRLWDRIRSLFSRDERLLFRYWDGIKHRAADPHEVWRKLWNTQDVSEFAQDVRRSTNPMRHDGVPFYPQEEVLAAEDRLRDLTRQVFGVQRWTEEQPGLTLAETDKLLNSFIEFIEDVKKKRESSPTQSPRMESTEPASSSDTAGFQTGVDSDYFSSPTGSNVAAPVGP